MNIMMLAELTSKWDPSGVWCLALIPVVLLILVVYASGLWGGSCMCCFFLLIGCLFTTDSSSCDPQRLGGRDMFVTNAAQDKWLKQSDVHLNDPHCTYIITDTYYEPGEERKQFYIPSNEMRIDPNGNKVMKNDGKDVEFRKDGYLLNEIVSNAIVEKKYGGLGIPTWVYHPAVVIWPFLIGSIPALGVSTLVLKGTK